MPSNQKTLNGSETVSVSPNTSNSPNTNSKGSSDAGVPKCALFFQVWYDHPASGFTRKEIVKATKLKSSYVGYLLSIHVKGGLLRQQANTRQYFITSTQALDHAVSRSVDAKIVRGLGLTTSPPRINISKSEHHLYYRGIDFKHPEARTAIEVYMQTARQDPGNTFASLTKKGDRAERIILHCDSFNANITTRTWQGTIYLKKPYEDWQAEVKATFGDKVLEQVKHEDAMVHADALLWEYRDRMLKDAGISVSIEEKDSQGGASKIELNGTSRTEAVLAFDAAGKRRLEETALWSKVRTALDAVESRLDAIEANNTMASQLQARTVQELGKIASILERMQPQAANGPTDPAKNPDPPRSGMYG